jgi:hypothetical protein
MVSSTRNRLILIGLSLLTGLAISCSLLFLAMSGTELAWTLQMPGFWIGAALGFGVHGALYLVGAFMNAVLNGALCFTASWLFRRAREMTKSG